MIAIIIILTLTVILGVLAIAIMLAVERLEIPDDEWQDTGDHDDEIDIY